MPEEVSIRGAVEDYYCLYCMPLPKPGEVYLMTAPTKRAELPVIAVALEQGVWTILILDGSVENFQERKFAYIDSFSPSYVRKKFKDCDEMVRFFLQARNCLVSNVASFLGFHKRFHMTLEQLVLTTRALVH